MTNQMTDAGQHRNVLTGKVRGSRKYLPPKAVPAEWPLNSLRVVWSRRSSKCRVWVALPLLGWGTHRGAEGIPVNVHGGPAAIAHKSVTGYFGVEHVGKRREGGGGGEKEGRPRGPRAEGKNK